MQDRKKSGDQSGFSIGESKPCFREFVFVRVDQIEPGIFLKQPYILEKGIGLKHVVMIEKSEPLAFSNIKAFV